MASVVVVGRAGAPSTLKKHHAAPRFRVHTQEEHAPRASVVLRAKGKTRMRRGGAPMQQQRPPTPPVDPDNEEFVVFVRAKKLPRWIPFTIVKGGAQANLLVRAMNGNFGKEFYTKTLINNIGQAIYKDRTNIVQAIRNGMPGYKNYKEFEFGFKVRDKSKPESWFDAEQVILLPPEEEIPKGPIDNMKNAVGGLFKGKQ